MRIMVFDVPAVSGGALSVLHDFYAEFKTDKENEYIFVVSLPELKETSNIKVLRFPWIKRSWAHRFYFDHFIASRLIKKYKVEKVLSLQNVSIPYTKVYQSVFVHNALPFSEYRFSFNENKFLWFYQNVIGRTIKKSIIKADHVIVQTNWMKEIFIDQLNISVDKVKVKYPLVNIEVNNKFQETKESLSTFFYPASPMMFKNHKDIIDACLKLKREGVENYQVIFTISGNEDLNILELSKIVKENRLPVSFVGNLPKEEVLKKYSKSILVFPSYIETVGLPLIEAKMHGTPIIVSDCPYSHEVLDGYKNVYFYDPFNTEMLSKILKKFIQKI